MFHSLIQYKFLNKFIDLYIQSIIFQILVSSHKMNNNIKQWTYPCKQHNKKIIALCFGDNCKGKRKLCEKCRQQSHNDKNHDIYYIDDKQHNICLIAPRYTIKQILTINSQPQKAIYQKTIDQQLGNLKQTIENLFDKTNKMRVKLRQNYFLFQPMCQAIIKSFNSNSFEQFDKKIKEQINQIDVEFEIQKIKKLEKKHIGNVQLLLKTLKIMNWKIQKAAIIFQKVINDGFDTFLKTVKQWSVFKEADWDQDIESILRSIQIEQDQQLQKNDRLKTQKLHKIIQTAKTKIWNPIITWLQSGKQLTEMKQLELIGNYSVCTNVYENITKIQNFSILRGLEKLILRGHQIIKIQGIQSLYNLIDLSLDYNQITKIQKIQHLTILKTLNLSNNRLNTIENLTNLANLITLNLSNNQIKTIEGLSTLRNLQRLWLHNNYIIKIQNLQDLNNLKYLDLENNKIKQVGNLSKLSKLQQIDLWQNPLQKSQKTQNNIKLLISKNVKVFIDQLLIKQSESFIGKILEDITIKHEFNDNNICFFDQVMEIFFIENLQDSVSHEHMISILSDNEEIL